MDTIQKACDLYAVKFSLNNQSFLSNNDHRKQDEDIHRYISIAVKTVPSPKHLFRNSCIFDSLINGLLVCTPIDNGVNLLAKAYKCLERYFILLVQQPWKPEYRTLKMYGGFYKTKIKSVLSRAETIFISAGYDEDTNNTMVYKKTEVDKPQLLILSFDCFVASSICERIVERHNQLKTVGKTLDDAICDILQTPWPTDKATDNKSKSLLTQPPEIPKREPMNNGLSSKKMLSKTIIYPSEPAPVYDANICSQDPEQSLGNFKYKSNNVDPAYSFSEEMEHYTKLPQATPEEHMHESLKLVKEQFDAQKYSRGKLDYPTVLQASTATLSPYQFPAFQDQFNQWHLNTECSKDEGIASMNIPTKSAVMSSSYPLINISTPLRSDQGYGTGQDMVSDPIYRPPDIVFPIAPPPIPSRLSKPVLRSEGMDVLDGPVKASHDVLDKVAIPATSHQGLPFEVGAGQWDNTSHSARLLHGMKSRSLKSLPKKLVADSRVTKSMDYKHQSWRCPMCESPNSSITLSCLQCSYSRFGELREQELKESSPKPCPTCTYNNKWEATNCDMCGGKLV